MIAYFKYLLSIIGSTLLKPFKDLILIIYWHSRFPKSRVSLNRFLPEQIKVKFGENSSGFLINIFGEYGCQKGHLYIGARTKIANNVSFIIRNTHKKGKPLEDLDIKEGFIDIGDDVWIGTGVIILPNVKIGNGATVGAGAVVTHDIKNNDTVVGNPAISTKKKTI